MNKIIRNLCLTDFAWAFSKTRPKCLYTWLGCHSDASQKFAAEPAVDILLVIGLFPIGPNPPRRTPGHGRWKHLRVRIFVHYQNRVFNSIDILLVLHLCNADSGANPTSSCFLWIE